MLSNVVRASGLLLFVARILKKGSTADICKGLSYLVFRFKNRQKKQPFPVEVLFSIFLLSAKIIFSVKVIELI